MTIQIYLALIVSLIGFVVWSVCTNATAKAALAKLGEVCFWTGMLAFLIAVSTHVVHF